MVICVHRQPPVEVAVLIDDHGRIDSNVGAPGASGWFNGDFNYDGKINIDDYGIIDSNIGQQSVFVSASRTADAGLPPLYERESTDDELPVQFKSRASSTAFWSGSDAAALHMLSGTIDDVLDEDLACACSAEH